MSGKTTLLIRYKIPYFLYLAPSLYLAPLVISPLKNGENLISPLPLFSPPPSIYIKRKHKVISSERQQYICSMQLKKHILVFKITVYCVSLVFAMISLTMMFMCKSRSAFLSSSLFKIAISFLSSADAKCLPGTTSPSSKYLDPVGENLR